MSSINSPGDDAVDRAIDRAVRQIMSADAPAGLRRRVLARIAEPAPSFAMLRPRFAMGVAAFAIVVLAVVMLRPSPQPATQAARTQPAAAVPMPLPEVATPQDAVARTEPAVPAPRPRATVTREAIPMPRVTNVFGERTSRATAASAPTDDVVFSQEDAASRASQLPGMPPPIAIPQITIAPLQVEVLRFDQAPIRK